MNFVLIFCNSTASRLIYAHSHYNMCAGGGYMYQISNEKFGLFVTELRKKKNLTQKDLAEIIYVFLTIFLYLLKCPQSLIL